MTAEDVTVLSTNKAVPFLMQSNLVLTATFADVTPPVMKIVEPTGLHLTNGMATIQVQATDNVGVANVEFFLNGQDFGPGLGLGSNLWSIIVAPTAGTNTVTAVATDAATNPTAKTIQFTYANTQINSNVISLAERHLVTDPPSPPGLYYGVIQDTGLLTSALTVPALQFMSADTWSNLFVTVSFGNLSFAGSLLGANVLTHEPGGVLFHQSVWLGHS